MKNEQLSATISNFPGHVHHVPVTKSCELPLRMPPPMNRLWKISETTLFIHCVALNWRDSGKPLGSGWPAMLWCHPGSGFAMKKISLFRSCLCKLFIDRSHAGFQSPARAICPHIKTPRQGQLTVTFHITIYRCITLPANDWAARNHTTGFVPK